MGSIGRYIFRTTLGAFLVVLVSVTTLMWMTQAMRNIDLITNQGQSVFVFVGITGLIIPLLIMLIAPFALMIAIAHVLNKLGNDSELIVMNAAGMPPWVLFRPFLAAGLVVSLVVAAISTYVSPWGLRETQESNHGKVTGSFTVVSGRGAGDVLEPAKKFYPQEQSPIAYVDYRLGFIDDLYVVLGDFARDGSHATIKMQVNRMVSWIWIGGLVLTLGTLLAVLPERRKPA